MKKLFENWRKHITEAAVPHSAHHVVKKMMKTGVSAKEALKSLTHEISDEEAERWLERHKDEMDSAKQDLASRNEAAYEPGRAGTFDIDTGEEHLSPEDINQEEIRDLADKFNVEASVEIASDGAAAILVRHQNGEITVYNDTEEMYQELASRLEMSEATDREIMIPGYGSMLPSQIKRKLAEMLREAAEDAAKDPPRYSHLDGGVIQALHQALKENDIQ
jgi:hypothetical protein